jgi:hypothetical protein
MPSAAQTSSIIRRSCLDITSASVERTTVLPADASRAATVSRTSSNSGARLKQMTSPR